MKNTFITFLARVERSNPVMLRRIHIPDTATVAELRDLAMISFGWTPENAENEKEEMLRPVSELPETEEEIRFPLTEPDKKNHTVGIVLSLGREENPKNEESTDPLPRVSLAIGWNLPEHAKEIRSVNAICNAVTQAGSCMGEDGAFYTDTNLAFREQKVLNQIRKRFAPETAKQEINMELGMPMGMILNSIRLPDLKQIAEAYEIYYESQIRKEFLIRSFCRKYNRDYLKQIFEELSLAEFNRFKEFVFSESPEKIRTDWDDELFAFFNRGLYSDVPKQGLRIASEVLEYYDEWCGTPAEEAFIRSKYMKTALHAAAALYGVFDTERFRALLKVISPEEIPEEEAKKFFSEAGHGFLHSKFRKLNSGLLYSADYLWEKEADALFRTMQPVWDIFFVPEKEEIEELAREKTLLSKEHDKTMRDFFSRFGRRGYYDYYSKQERENYESVVNELRREGNAESAAKVAERELYYLQWRPEKKEVLSRVESVLKQEAGRIPLFSLNGYTKKNCPKKLLDFRKEIEKKRQEAEERKVSVKPAVRTVAVKKAMSAKKAVPVKKKRGY